MGIEASLTATALGAVVIEKHLTLSRGMQGPDHKASIEPDEFSQMVKSIRNIESSLGSEDKKPHQVENWLNVFNHHFGNTKLSRVYIPSFDCSWNFSSSINH